MQTLYSTKQRMLSSAPHCRRRSYRQLKQNHTSNVYRAFKALMPSKRTMVVGGTDCRLVESRPITGQQQMHRPEDHDDMKISEDLPHFCNAEDLGPEDSPEGKKYDQSEIEVPTIDWDSIMVVPVKTWEDLAEESLWDDFARNPLPVRKIKWDELVEQKNQETVRAVSATEVELDKVVLYQLTEKRRRWVEGPKKVRDVKKAVEIYDSKKKTSGQTESPWWDFMLKFAQMMRSITNYEIR